MATTTYDASGGRLDLVAGVAAADLRAEPGDRVVLAVHHPLLHRDDRVVGDVDALRAHLGAALGDVAHPEPGRVLGELAPVVHVERCMSSSAYRRKNRGPANAFLFS